MEYLFIVISSFLSGIIGVVVSAFYYSKKERKNIQVKLITELFANRHKLTGNEFSKAINSVPIVFSESKEIISCYNNFHDFLSNNNTPHNSELINQKLFEFLNLIIKHTQLYKNGLDNDVIRHVFGE